MPAPQPRQGRQEAGEIPRSPRKAALETSASPSPPLAQVAPASLLAPCRSPSHPARPPPILRAAPRLADPAARSSSHSRRHTGTAPRRAPGRHTKPGTDALNIPGDAQQSGERAREETQARQPLAVRYEGSTCSAGMLASGNREACLGSQSSMFILKIDLLRELGSAPWLGKSPALPAPTRPQATPLFPSPKFRHYSP